MTARTFTVWHCDASCDASALAETPGWVKINYSHGCPAHAAVIAAHEMSATWGYQGMGRNRSRWTVLSCSCGRWQSGSLREVVGPGPDREYWQARADHLAHIKAKVADPDDRCFGCGEIHGVGACAAEFH
ncbi:hypothetical protein OG884_06010 [Streptosporangium sp. NBC_01755]|uniref:hypothetical protein n=1 Tax=unclassified Streptosporangium TaxID=2632669 RepID=UPI002DDBBF39|nr:MULTISPECIES: hypothetical protein [unclassified Streptosporangium]WSA23732.1 hypothetical protein OIE13_22585 [Streptosporangium sp. NBC_01810]WSD01481.1 hypothetical protein OG884_06010 [Streptosporangium sp. NBC_01755]